jgi:hypothetical protein
MTSSDADTNNLQLRPLYPRDVDTVGDWNGHSIVITDPSAEILNDHTHRFIHHPLASWWQRVATLALPNRPRWSGFVAVLNDDVCGVIEVSPFNRTRSTWRVDRLAVSTPACPPSMKCPLDCVGSQLLRQFFQTICEARMWLA